MERDQTISCSGNRSTSCSGNRSTSIDVTRRLMNLHIDFFDGTKTAETLFEGDIDPYPYDEEYPPDEGYISDEDPYSGDIVVLKPERHWLSEYEIARNLRIKTNVRSGESEEDEEVCAICLVEYKNTDKIGSLQCPHYFHEECIKNWLQQKNTCPLCKGRALDTESTTPRIFYETDLPWE